MKEVIIGGIYRHFKGKMYKVLNVATHSETEETMVVYMKLYDDYTVWVRPLELFMGEKQIGDKMVERFEHVK